MSKPLQLIEAVERFAWAQSELTDRYKKLDRSVSIVGVPEADLHFYFDPVCQFAWMTSKWVRIVMAARDYRVEWRLISLRMVNEHIDYEHLKESLNKVSSGLDDMLNRTGSSSQKPTNSPFQGGKQTGRNQTFGADVNRAGVPRRTGGG